MNGAEQMNLVTQLFVTLAFKSQETEDPALYELEIRFSHQAKEGAELERGHGFQFPLSCELARGAGTAGGHSPSEWSSAGQWPLRANPGPQCFDPPIFSENQKV